MRILLWVLLLAVSVGAQIPRGAEDLGQAPRDLEMRQVFLLLRRTPKQKARLQKLLLEQQTVGAAQYHHWLSPAAYGERFGASAAAQEQVAFWLRQQGFQNIRFHPGGTVLSFDGSAGDIGDAFGTVIQVYGAGQKRLWANRTRPLVPGPLRDLVSGVVALNNVPLAAGMALGHAEGELSRPGFPQPAFTFSNAQGQPRHALVPADFGVLFQMQPLWEVDVNGKGASIAIVARSNINLADVADFRQLFVASDAANLPVIVVSGPDPGELHDGDEYEAELDSEWAGALAPAAQVKIVVSASTAATDGIILSAQYIVEHDLADVMSLSYTACEAQLGDTENQFWNSLFEQAAAEGITVVASSGDSGAAGCDINSTATPAAAHGLGVNGLASTPYDTAVGGTRLLDDGAAAADFWSATNNAVNHGSALAAMPETAWNDSCLDPVRCDPAAPLSASGGGNSYLYPRPAWQQGPGGSGGGMRQIPDVAFAASPYEGYLVCAEASCHTPAGGLFGYFIFGGTSAAAPAFAALVAMLDEANGGRQGLVNPALYRLAQPVSDEHACDASLGAAAAPSCVFADITSGNNAEPCVAGSPGCVTETAGANVLPGYAAAVGYDPVSGLGSVHASALARAWSASTARAPTQTQLQWEQQSKSRIQVCVQGDGDGLPTGSAAVLQVPAGALQQQLAIVALSPAAGEACGTWTSSRLPGGQYALQARYSGDTTFAPSLSDPVAVSAPLAATTSSLAAYLSGAMGVVRTQTAPYGSPLQFTLQVRGPADLPPPAGSARLENNVTGAHQQAGARGLSSAQALAEWPLNAQGEASPPAGLVLPPGQYNLVAAYDGGAGFAPSRSSLYSLNIVRAATSVAFQADATLPWMQLTATVTASGNASVPSGEVTFFAGSHALGQIPLVAVSTAPVSGEVAAEAHFIAPAGAAKARRYSAQYTGDDNFLASAPFTLTPAATSMTLTAGADGQLPLTLTAVAGFHGTVGLSCTILPAGPRCGLSPTQVSLNGQEATAQLFLATNASGSTLWLWLLLTLPLWPACMTRRRPRRRLAWVVVWGLCACACGAPPAALRAAATPGIYQVFVRAASAGDTSLQQITLYLR